MKKLLYLFSLLLISSNLIGQTWSRSYNFETFNENNYNCVYSFDTLAGGLIAAPTGNLNAAADQAIDLIRINRYGDTTSVQHNIFNTLITSPLNGLVRLTNGKYVLAASTSPYYIKCHDLCRNGTIFIVV